ncbi:S9 family peptidase [Sphingomonas sp.]|uniref:S9 family peptidase n=1 Tax=Sphingomonas sp. TaxID=28214 RepID=UPI003D6CCC0C
MPPEPIRTILDHAPTPDVLIAPGGATLALLDRETMPPVRSLAEPAVRLAGQRLNPRTNGPVEARARWQIGITLQDVATGQSHVISLPRAGRFFAATWSPDGRYLAFVLGVSTGLELWIADARDGTARRLSGPSLNAAFGTAFSWLPNSSGLVALMVPPGRGAAPAAAATAPAPIVEENGGGVIGRRTYQDLLGGPADEQAFDYYFTSRIAIIGLDGTIRAIGAPGLYRTATLSPDGRYLLIERVKRPYSHTVPAALFPTEISVLAVAGGTLAKLVVDRLAADKVPADFDARVPGPRDVAWRADAPSTLIWVEALDNGDPQRSAPMRDRVSMLSAPFDGTPAILLDVPDRVETIDWGTPSMALVRTRWSRTRMESYVVTDPSRPDTQRTILRRNYQGRYDDPGTIAVRPGPRGAPVLHLTADGGGVLTTGLGFTPRGAFPFLGRLDLTSGVLTKLWQSDAAYFEVPMGIADAAGTRIITRRESRDDTPNYFLRSLAGGAPHALTHFVDPAPQFAGVTKRTLDYARADGVKLSGTLYLPAGYRQDRDGPLPMLIWAYPEDYTDAAVASQTIDMSNRFLRPAGASPLFLLTQGYAVLDGPSMPIVGKDGAPPNDSYIAQLTADAAAAVDAAVATGAIDRGRIAIGGHSYGAFMAANLLAHTDLFRAGIARSGAYNRTLTPFGFQSEQRSYWQATETYNAMSPFAYADRIKAPLLLIHGAADDNDGTFPLQSERFYAALKGVGATTRYVVLPYEAHDYRARESNLDVLAEMVDWMDRHVQAGQ